MPVFTCNQSFVITGSVSPEILQKKRGLNQEDEPSISKIERVTAIFVGQGMTKSHFLQIFKCQYLVEILRYGSNFLHVIITFIGFKITFSNIRSHGTPLLISRGWRLAPPPDF